MHNVIRKNDRMLDLDSSLRLISRELTGQTYHVFVVDSALQVVLSGHTPSDIEPPAAGTQLPPDVAATLAMLAHDHDFGREQIARARSNEFRQIRVVKMTGPAGIFYGVMSTEPPEAL